MCYKNRVFLYIESKAIIMPKLKEEKCAVNWGGEEF
jgi:hypothetical protein